MIRGDISPADFSCDRAGTYRARCARYWPALVADVSVHLRLAKELCLIQSFSTVLYPGKIMLAAVLERVQLDLKGVLLTVISRIGTCQLWSYGRQWTLAEATAASSNPRGKTPDIPRIARTCHYLPCKRTIVPS